MILLNAHKQDWIYDVLKGGANPKLRSRGLGAQPLEAIGYLILLST